jgi:hypothetical protein
MFGFTAPAPLAGAFFYARRHAPIDLNQRLYPAFVLA